MWGALPNEQPQRSSLVNITEIEMILNTMSVKETIKGIYPRWLGLGNLSSDPSHSI